jgi:hypothetical protein
MSDGAVVVPGEEGMPYLCQVAISGPEPDANGVAQMMDAVSEAIRAGWEVPRISGDEEEAGARHHWGHLTGRANKRAHSGDLLQVDVVLRRNTGQHTEVLLSAGHLNVGI